MEVAKSSNKADHSHKDIVSFLSDKRADQERYIQHIPSLVLIVYIIVWRIEVVQANRELGQVGS